MDKKRLVFALIFVVICVLLGYALYRVFFSKAKPTELTDTNGPTSAEQFPQVGEGKPAVTIPEPTSLPTSQGRPINEGGTIGTTQPTIGGPAGGLAQAFSQPLAIPVKSPAPAGNGGIKFYNQEDGRFYRLLPDGNVVRLGDQVFFNVENVKWSPTKNESIIEYPDGANIFYNFDNKEQVTLPKHWENFSFSPLGDKIAAKSIGLDRGNRWLITSQPNGSEIKLLEPLGDNADKVKVDWSPNKQVVALSRTGQALGPDQQQVFLVGLNKENFKSLTVEGRGLESTWSPEGKKLLHSVYNAQNDFKPQLWIVNADPDSVGSNRKPLNLDTWASKCAMTDERFVYCGVPTRLETGAGFAPAIADQIPDTIYKIDTVTGQKTEIPTDDNFTINSIIVGDNGQSLYFTDKNKTGMFKVAI